MTLTKRETSYKVFGDKRTVSKVDLLARNEIMEEDFRKECHQIKIDNTDQNYIFEDYASKIYKNIRKIYGIKDDDLYK